MDKEYIKQLTQLEKEDCFLVACFESDIETVKYITSGLDFPSIDIFCADMNSPEYRDGVSLEYAAEKGSLEIVQYLIKLPRGEQLYKKIESDLFNMAYTNRHMDIIYYLIFEKGIEEKTIEAYKNRNKTDYEELMGLLSKKNLYVKLKENLVEKKHTTIKIKNKI